MELPHTEPTRVFNVLDKLFTSDCLLVDPEAFTHVVNTDQLLPNFSVCSKKSRHVLWTIKDDRENNRAIYSVLLKNTDFGYLFELGIVDKMCKESFNFFSALDATCSIRKVKMCKNEPPYVTPALNVLCKKEQRLQLKSRSYRVKTVDLKVQHLISITQNRKKFS